MYLKIALFSVFVFNVLAFEQNIQRNEQIYKTGISPKLSDVLKRSLRQTSDENPTDSTNEENSSPTETTIVESNPLPKDEGNELPKEEEPKDGPKEEDEIKKEETTKEDLNVKKEGERIEREDEDEKVTPESPKEVESMTPSSSTALPPVTQPSTPPPPPRPSVPSVTIPTVPANRPVYPFSPEFPSSGFPNYWQNPNWGNWGRFVPTQTANWPGQQWPTFNSWPSMSPVPSVPSVSTVAQMPSYNPSNYNPNRFSPFAMNPSSGVSTFSFIVPQNPSYGAGRGFQYPGVSPSVPNFSGYQPSYQPRFIPSGGPTQRIFPGTGGRTPGYYPSVGQRPSFYPGTVPQSPRYYPGESGPPSPPVQPGADPNQPMGPMGPELNNPDATMIDPNLMRGNDNHQGGIRRFPGKFRRFFI